MDDEDRKRLFTEFAGLVADAADLLAGEGDGGGALLMEGVEKRSEAIFMMNMARQPIAVMRMYRRFCLEGQQDPAPVLRLVALALRAAREAGFQGGEEGLMDRTVDEAAGEDEGTALMARALLTKMFDSGDSGESSSSFSRN